MQRYSYSEDSDEFLLASAFGQEAARTAFMPPRFVARGFFATNDQSALKPFARKMNNDEFVETLVASEEGSIKAIFHHNDKLITQTSDCTSVRNATTNQRVAFIQAYNVVTGNLRIILNLKDHSDSIINCFIIANNHLYAKIGLNKFMVLTLQGKCLHRILILNNVSQDANSKLYVVNDTIAYINASEVKLIACNERVFEKINLGKRIIATCLFSDLLVCAIENSTALVVIDPKQKKILQRFDFSSQEESQMIAASKNMLALCANKQFIAMATDEGLFALNPRNGSLNLLMNYKAEQFHSVGLQDGILFLRLKGVKSDCLRLWRMDGIKSMPEVELRKNVTLFDLHDGKLITAQGQIVYRGKMRRKHELQERQVLKM